MERINFSKKAIGGFLALSLMLMAAGIVGIMELKKIDKSASVMYEESLMGFDQLVGFNISFLAMRTAVADAISNKFLSNRDISQDIKAVKDLDAQGAKAIAGHEILMHGDPAQKILKDLKDELANYYPLRDQAMKMAGEGNKEETIRYPETEVAPRGAKIAALLKELLKLNADTAKLQAGVTGALAGPSTLISVLIAAIGFIMSGLFGYFLFMRTDKDIERSAADIGRGDYPLAAVTLQASRTFQPPVEEVSNNASVILKTSSSLEEMSSMTRQSADHAGQASRMAEGAMEQMKKARGSMRELVESIQDISKASDETQKIVKTIDEIAFQTNLLALNAAVEAARAGEAGAGFAVVADEVRNLAMRAAKAAKNTSELIEETARKIRYGNELIGQTDSSYRDVAVTTKKVTDLIAEIAAATREQAIGIGHIKAAIAELDGAI